MNGCHGEYLVHEKRIFERHLYYSSAEELGPFNEVDQRLKTVSVVQKCRSSRSSTVNFADRKRG
jgi:hypothetical protein